MASNADGQGQRRRHSGSICGERICRGGNFAGQNLRYADFRAADLREVNFTGSDLSYADFREAQVQRAIFQNASLYAPSCRAWKRKGRIFAMRTCAWRIGVDIPCRGLTPWADRTPSPAESDDAKHGLASSPGAIAYDEGQHNEVWGQNITGDKKDHRGGKPDHGRNEQAKGQTLPQERRNKGRGRGP